MRAVEYVRRHARTGALLLSLALLLVLSASPAAARVKAATANANGIWTGTFTYTLDTQGPADGAGAKPPPTSAKFTLKATLDVQNGVITDFSADDGGNDVFDFTSNSSHQPSIPADGLVQFTNWTGSSVAPNDVLVEITSAANCGFSIQFATGVAKNVSPFSCAFADIYGDPASLNEGKISLSLTSPAPASSPTPTPTPTPSTPTTTATPASSPKPPPASTSDVTTRVKVIATVNGNGRITGGAINCPGRCTATLTKSVKKVRLTAIPAPGYRFAGWSGSCPGKIDGLTPCTAFVLVFDGEIDYWGATVGGDQNLLPGGPTVKAIATFVKG